MTGDLSNKTLEFQHSHVSNSGDTDTQSQIVRYESVHTANIPHADSARNTCQRKYFDGRAAPSVFAPLLDDLVGYLPC